MKYPKKVLLCILRDGFKVYETVDSEEEYEQLCEEIETGQEYVRNYFKQYAP